MLGFLGYEGKAAVALAVFYMFYRLLLKKETFHRFNRVVLVGTAVLSFLLPLCVITVRRPMELAPAGLVEALEAGSPGVSVPTAVTAAQEAASAPWWPMALTLLFFAGIAFVLLRLLVSILSILRILRHATCVGEEDGCRIMVTDWDIDPFSWMRYIVLSRKDWEAPHDAILTHEKAHIAYGHSADLLLVSVLSAFQWFNPAIWMLRADLQELHEFEADDAVLRSGANIRDYQYLLIRKAVGKSGYSVANSFNHSILKNRITMMSKSRSPLARGLRALWMLPLVCLAIGLQAQTVYVPTDKGNEKIAADETDAVKLTVKANGTVLAGEQVIPLAEVAAYLNGQDNTDTSPKIRIYAASNVKMGFIDDLKEELRKVKGSKLFFSLEGGERVNAMMPMPTTPSGPAKDAKYPPEILPGVPRENICRALLNRDDKIFFDDGAYQDDATILRHGVAFIEKHGREARFVMRHDRASSFGAYLHLQNLVLQIYDQARDAKAQEVYGKPMSELTLTEKNRINWLLPYSISESDPKG
jgi:beta-lactamase regulating signal transducer with metallopeptidase domain